MLGLLSLLATATPLVGAGPDLRIHINEMANLTHQLDCLAHKDCAFGHLWRQKLGWTADDDAALAEREEIKRRYTGLQFGANSGGIQLDHLRMFMLSTKLRRAALGARDLDDYRGRLSLVVRPPDAEALIRLTERFHARFRGFFAENLGRLRTFQAGLSEMLRRPAIRDVVAKAARYYEVAALRPRVDIFLIALPPDWKGDDGAEQIEDQSIVEVPAGESAQERVSIVLHEMFHYFYSAAPLDRALALARAFGRSADPAAISGYGLLNESLAAAFSAGLVRRAYRPRPAWEEDFRRKLSFYGTPAIDATAKALLPFLEGEIAAGHTLYDDAFVSRYTALCRAAVGRDFDRPALGLRIMNIAFDDSAMEPAVDLIQEEVRPGIVFTGSPLEDHTLRDSLGKDPDKSAVLMVQAAHLEHLAPWETLLGAGLVGRMQELARKHGTFVVTVPRSTHSRIYLLVGSNGPSFVRLARALIDAPAPFEVIAGG